MRKKEKQFLMLAAVAVLAIIVFGNILRSPATVVGLNPVLVPRIGAVWCEEGAFTSTQQWSHSLTVNSGGVFSLAAQYNMADVINLSLPYSEKVFVCQSSYCHFDNPSFDNFYCRNGLSIYDIVTVAGIQESARWVYDAPYRVHEVTKEFPDAFIELGDGDTVTVRASCITSWSALTGVSAENPYFMTFGYRERKKQLVGYFDGTKLPVMESDGCLRGDLSNYIREKALTSQPQEGVTIPVVYDNDGLPGQGSVKPKQELWTQTLLPTALKVGEAREFIYEFREIPSFGNVISLDTGQDVYAVPIFNTVYEIQQIRRIDGSYIYVAGDVYKSGVQCTTHEECPGGMFCDMESGRFVCDTIVPTCVVDADCGVSDFETLGDGSVVFIKHDCVSGSCTKTVTTVVCNPKKVYPYNGCPSTTTECRSDGLECYQKVIPPQPCPFGCCLGDEYYVQKNCPSGQICKTNGTTVGFCVDIPSVCTCGDGVCDGPGCEAENASSCVIDCGKTCLPPFIYDELLDDCVCPVGTHLVNTETPIYLIPLPWGGGLIQIGTEKNTTCVSDINWTLVILGVAVLAFVLVLVWVLRKPKRRKPKRKRRR